MAKLLTKFKLKLSIIKLFGFIGWTAIIIAHYFWRLISSRGL